MHRRAVALLQQRDDVELVGLELGETAADFFDTKRIPDYIRAAKESFPIQLAEIESALRHRGKRNSGQRAGPRRGSAALSHLPPWLRRVFGRAPKR